MIFAAAQDAGGCNALLPVLEALKDRGLPVRIWADGPAWSILRRAGFDPRRLSAESARDGLGLEFDPQHPTLVLVGNSYGASLEDEFVAEARTRGIPSVGLLDSWLLYEKKFCAGDDAWALLPDTLIVMDEHARDEMVSLGAPAERLVPLGQPQFDRLEGRAREFTAARRRTTREGLGTSESEKLVLFLSQDMANFYGGAEKARETIGYTEFDAVCCLEDAIRAISLSRGVTIRGVIKLHPREDLDKYADRGDTFSVTADADPYEIAQSADLVVGMDTILLVEAGLLGCPTLSFQPRRRGVDTLITNRLGLGRFCYEPDALRGQVEELLYDARARAEAVASMRQFPMRPGATRRVTDWVVGCLSESLT